MSSSSATPPAKPNKKPTRSSLPADDVRRFRAELANFLDHKDDNGRKWADAKWGVYAFYDYDGEPIYVGQTNERLRTRIRRHLTNQRSDAVAMRILDVFEVAEVEIYPLWHMENANAKSKDAKRELDAHEYTAYVNAIENSRFKAILNEKIPPPSALVTLPPSLRWKLIDDEMRKERGHADIRIARRAETIARLAAVARERGEVSDGLRRVLVIQAVRLAYISAVRLAIAKGHDAPDPTAINVNLLIGEESEDDEAAVGDDEEGDDD